MHSMNDECQSQLAEAKKMLGEAQSQNASGQHGAAMKLSYEASELIAASYLTSVTGRTVVPSDSNFDLFVKTIQDTNNHSLIADKIGGIVSSVCVLREAYEPTLLDETTHKDAQQFIDCTIALTMLVVEIVKGQRSAD
jgi:hypothetical protein